MDSITSKQEKLTDKHKEEDKDESKLDSEDLSNNLDEAKTSRAIESSPRIGDAEFSATSQNSGDHLTTERTVKGNDGLVLFGEHGSSHADEDGTGGDRDEESEE